MRTWFITCITTGLARVLIENLLRRGDQVAVAPKYINALDDLKLQYGDSLWITELDVTEPGTIQKVVSQAFLQMKQIDVVINIAADAPCCTIKETGSEDFRQEINMDKVASCLIIKAASSQLSAQGCGRIIQLSFSGSQNNTPIRSGSYSTDLRQIEFTKRNAGSIR